jgi:ABC-type nitrate/sulfonate/bicarbonate transport system ATPase subunit
MNGEIPVISIQGLSKSFRKNDGDTLRVLDDINLDVYQNEIIGVIGHSGCGKSTLLRIVCAFDTSDAGLVLADGGLHEKPRKDILMLFQNFEQLLPWLSVLDNIAKPLLASHRLRSKKDAVKRAVKLVSDVGLNGFERSFPHQLSGGMKQRGAVARALAFQPRVLLMDEPFASLDNITRGALQVLTRNVCEKYGITVIFVTHSVEEAMIMADRIVVMEKNPGRIKRIVDNPNKSEISRGERNLIIEDIMKLL